MAAAPPPPTRAWVALALGALAWALLTQLVDRVPQGLGEGPGEGLALRWLRKLGEHPVRGSLALALGLRACLPTCRDRLEGGSEALEADLR